MPADQLWGACGQCGAPATESVITVNGWALDVCHRCAVEACDPGYQSCAPSPVQI
jgi:hypothetical protein